MSGYITKFESKRCGSISFINGRWHGTGLNLLFHFEFWFEFFIKRIYILTITRYY